MSAKIKGIPVMTTTRTAVKMPSNPVVTMTLTHVSYVAPCQASESLYMPLTWAQQRPRMGKYSSSEGACLRPLPLCFYNSVPNSPGFFISVSYTRL
jgi:hypothetical protein